MFQQVQVLEDELTEEKSWGHRRDRGKLIFRPSGIVVGKFLRLTYDPNLPGEAHRSGWQARYRVLPFGNLQIYDFVDLRPEEADFRDMPVSKKERRGLLPLCRLSVGSGSESSRLECAKEIAETEFCASISAVFPLW